MDYFREREFRRELEDRREERRRQKTPEEIAYEDFMEGHTVDDPSYYKKPYCYWI